MQLLCFHYRSSLLLLSSRVLTPSHPSLIPTDSWWVVAGTLGLDSCLIYYSADAVAHRDRIWIKAEPQKYLTATFAFFTLEAQTTVTQHKNHSHRLDPLCEWAAVQTLGFEYQNVYILALCHSEDWGYLYYMHGSVSCWAIRVYRHACNPKPIKIAGV